MKDWRNKVRDLKDTSERETLIIPPERKKSSYTVYDVSEKELDIHVGIDFGTTWTKVAYRNLIESYSADVVFTGKDGKPTSFARSILYQNNKEGYRFPLDIGSLESSVQPGERLVRDLKMKLNSENHNESDYRASVFFLSRIIRKSMDYILDQYEHAGTETKISWTATIGMPTAFRDSPIERRNHRLLRQAWYMADRWESDSITKEELDLLIHEEITIPRSYFTVMPELQANIYALTHSSKMPDGLYALFDIGGGTIDGSVFNIQRNEGVRQVSVYQTRVDDLGVDVLLQLMEKEGYLVDKDNKILNWRDVMKKNLFILPEEIQSGRLNTFTQPIIIHTGKVVWNSKCSTKYESVWYEESLPILYCGGGADYHWYRKTIESTYAINNYAQSRIPKFVPREIPKPDEEEFQKNNISNNEFARFFVAYGLSFPEEDHHHIVAFPEHYKVERSEPSDEREHKRWIRMNELYGEGYV